MKKIWTEWKGIILFGSFAILCISLIYGLDIVGRINIPALRDYVLSLGIWGEILYVLAYTIRPFFFFPATPMTLFGGYTFGAVKGTILDIIGAGTGALLAFLLARHLGRQKIEHWLKGKKIARFDQSIQRNGFLVVLYMRLIPLFGFDMLNYSLGLSAVKTRSYAAATYLGIIPGAFVLNFLGSSIGSSSEQLTLAIAMYALLILVPLIIKWKTRNKQPAVIKSAQTTK